MAALSEIAKYVRPDVDGCPDIVILDAILRAGIEFCKRTKSIRQTLTLSTVVNQQKYTLNPSAGTEVDEILASDDLSPSSFKEFQQSGINRQSGTPRFCYMEGDSELVLAPKPNAVESLSVIVKIRPSEDATTLPDALVNRYKHQIASGAKSILMMMKNKPWTDLDLAGTHAGLFNTAIADLNSREARGQARKPQRVTAHHF